MWAEVVAVLFALAQILYFLTFLVDAYFFGLPTDAVDMHEPITEPESEWPYVVLFYPVLRELEATMRTTMLSLSHMDYPAQRYRVIAIPNSSDRETIASLRRLTGEFAFLEILEIPPTSDPSWEIVWNAWDANPKTYWWHQGKRAGVKDLPPKKTRQLVYAFYRTAADLAARNERNVVINYIDADSCPPRDHFKAAVIGLKHYDVLQAENVAGNLNATMFASWHAFDHMAWDGYKYAHLSSHGRQPYWLLGKGLFYKASDLLELGGFHPWITIEDPEVGMRFWANGKRLGILRSSLIEEVPETWWRGVIQRKRWVCGFFQSLARPLRYLGLTPIQRFKCRLIFLPCLSLWINALGIPTGIWALVTYFKHDDILPVWVVTLACLNLALFVTSMSALYVNTWRRTGLVLNRWQERVSYMLRVNPVFVVLWWVLWLVPLAIGLGMYLRDEGLVWERTEKIDANNLLVRAQLRREARTPDAAVIRGEIPAGSTEGSVVGPPWETAAEEEREIKP